MTKPRYDVETYDINKGDYTPQKGVRCRNLTLWGVRRCLKELRRIGYTCHRFRTADGRHDESDPDVYVSRRS